MRRSWTDEQLADALLAGGTSTEVARRLGQQIWSRTLEAGCQRLGLPSPVRPQRRAWTDAELRQLVESGLTRLDVATALGLSQWSTSMTEACVRMGIDPPTRRVTNRTLPYRVAELERRLAELESRL